MKYLKTYEVKTENKLPPKRYLVMYPIIYDFLVEIKPEQRYIVRNNYPAHYKSGKGLAFGFGSKILFSIKVISTIISTEIEMNCCSTSSKQLSNDIIDFLRDIFKKYSFYESKTTCFYYFDIYNDNIQSIKNDLTKENFEMFVDAKKYNL